MHMFMIYYVVFKLLTVGVLYTKIHHSHYYQRASLRVCIACH